MWSRIPKPVRYALFFGILGLFGLQIIRTLAAAPVTAPLARDEKRAERIAISRVGGIDLRAPIPESAGLVGGNGVVEPAQRETRVAAQVTAVVRKVAVAEGERVKAGDLLVQLANEVELAAQRAAEADAAAERANLDRALRGLRVEERDAAAAEVQSARARSEQATSVAARTEQLAASGAATQEEVDRTRRQAQADAATLKVAQSRLRAADAGSRGEEIAFQRARLLSAEARSLQARATVERLAVRSPLDGEVLQVKVRAGELYSFQGSEPLVILGDTRQLRVRMDVDERDIARVRQGALAYVTADAFGARRFAGKVVEIGRRFGRKNIRTDDPIEKNDTKILEVVIELESNDLLVPGQRVVSYVTAATGPRS